MFNSADKHKTYLPPYLKGNATKCTCQVANAAHFATYPEKLIEPCVLAGTKKGDTIIDPFFGAGTTGVVSYKYNRNFIGIELNQEYCEIAAKRIENERKQLKMF